MYKIRTCLLAAALISLAGRSYAFDLNREKKSLQESLEESGIYSGLAVEEKILNNLYAEGIVAFKEQRYAEAMENFTRIIVYNPDFKNTSFMADITQEAMANPSLTNRGDLFELSHKNALDFYMKGQIMKAIHLWENLEELFPENKATVQKYIKDAKKVLAGPYYSGGWNEYNKENYARAIELWEIAISLNEEYRDLDKLIMGARERSSKVAFMSQVKEIEEKIEKGNFSSARAQIKGLMEKYKDNQYLKDLMGKVELERGARYTQNFNGGMTSYNAGDFQKAITYFERALNYTDKRDAVLKYINDARTKMASAAQEHQAAADGGAAAEESPSADAAKSSKVVSEENQALIQQHYNQGLYYYKNGYIEKAINEWQIVLSIDPEYEKAFVNLERAKALLKK